MDDKGNINAVGMTEGYWTIPQCCLMLFGLKETPEPEMPLFDRFVPVDEYPGPPIRNAGAHKNFLQLSRDHPRLGELFILAIKATISGDLPSVPDDRSPVPDGADMVPGADMVRPPLVTMKDFVVWLTSLREYVIPPEMEKLAKAQGWEPSGETVTERNDEKPGAEEASKVHGETELREHDEDNTTAKWWFVESEKCMVFTTMYKGKLKGTSRFQFGRKNTRCMEFIVENYPEEATAMQLLQAVYIDEMEESDGDAKETIAEYKKNAQSLVEALRTKLAKDGHHPDVVQPLSGIDDIKTACTRLCVKTCIRPGADRDYEAAPPDRVTREVFQPAPYTAESISQVFEPRPTPHRDPDPD